MWSGGFNKNSGPGTTNNNNIIPKQQSQPRPLFGYRPPPASQSPSQWFNGASSKPEGHQSPAVPPNFPSTNPGAAFPATTQAQDLKRTRSPPRVLTSYKDALQNSGTAAAGSGPVPQMTNPPPSMFQKTHAVQGFGPPSETKRSYVSPPRLRTKPNSHADSKSQVWVSSYADLDKPEEPATNPSDIPGLKRSRSPFPASNDQGWRGNTSAVHDDTESHRARQISDSPPRIYKANHPVQGFGPSSETKRPSVSPPRLRARPNSDADSKSQVWVSPYADLDKPEAPAPNPSDIPVLKRSRSPFSAPNDPGLRGNTNILQDDTDRELQAKAKRLARFRNELSQPEPSDTVNKNQKPQQVDQLGLDKRKASDMTVHNSNLQMDGDDQDSSTVIIGYCPDMCPEQERAERERKGDLDQYERLDGDRNQTTESLAVKKYTRTAEREASLIRPMEILQKTMDYLLNLLDQPYDDRLLGLYNFLWDRMRAIRMDLRMQHLFNLGAITMLEQMIRLHIIAMHELCQYTKGEGFSEGFDAHLNIEQMNKTSVELFQLYDDHRKKGIEVPTEREFRGYYALLKLDKHPGYKVEPSELSLDLAKMTPGIRQATEVLFARSVARACRTGNYIAFFRLVRKASYLQACLMHAHFGKLRTQALASLHSGLQNNQGIPVSQVAKWLGMEEENMEDLAEYHGYSIKEFEEPYLVKERLFLNSDSEYPLKCSKLVHLKRSPTIAEDVLSSSLITSLPSTPLERRTSLPSTPFKRKTSLPRMEVFRSDVVPLQEKSTMVLKEDQTFAKAIDSNMADYEGVLPVQNKMLMQPMFNTPTVNRWDEDHMEDGSPSARDTFKRNNSFKSPVVVTPSVAEPRYDVQFRNSLEKNRHSNVPAIQIPTPTATPIPQVIPTKVSEETLPDVQMDSPPKDPIVHHVYHEDTEPEDLETMIQEVPDETDTSIDEEVAEAKLKLILRLWRRHAFRKKDLRERRQLAADAALSLLSLGPPMRHYKELLQAPGECSIDSTICERYRKQEQLWSTLNVSKVVAETLGQRYRYPKCVCWKLLFCSLETGTKVSKLDPASWLRYKLMPENLGNNDDLVTSLADLSIWKKWEYGKCGDLTCYLSVVKSIQFNNLLKETVLGSSAIMFLASECISWEDQKIRLDSLVSSIPYGSCLPLLILVDSSESRSDPSVIVKRLGLNEIDKSTVSCFAVIPFDGFSGDESLRTGLEWLAKESPAQPIVHCVKTRELVLTHLKISIGDRKTSPEECISAINEALDESIKEIGEAAKSNPVCWPCPEISLLNERDCRILEPYLPNVGWSSATRIESLAQALRNCKLPTIPNDIYWCRGVDINEQRLELEHFLVSYLSPLMGMHVAQREASTLVQTCVGLELHGSTYHLVPKWHLIFRRVFNWQLMSLTNSAFSVAYILEKHHNAFLSASENFEDESYNLTSPTLDEMIEVSCCRPGLESDYKEYEATVCDPPEVEMVVSGDDSVEEETNYTENEGKENERSLSRLLEQCNIVQDIIDKKLSVYF